MMQDIPHSNHSAMTSLQKCSFCDNFVVDSLDVSLHRDVRPRRPRSGIGFLAISYNERKRLDVIERREKVHRQRNADTEWENKQLRQKLKDVCQENERLAKAVTHLQMQQEEENDRKKQLEMIIDMLNMKIRFYEGKLDRLSKKFLTIIKDQ